jgi:hypothetical protein
MVGLIVGKKSSTTLLFGEREGEIDGACVGLFDGDIVGEKVG